MSRDAREQAIQDACADFRKVLIGLFVDQQVSWRRHFLGLLASIAKLVRADSN